jgi:hypothetical protein
VTELSAAVKHTETLITLISTGQYRSNKHEVRRLKVESVMHLLSVLPSLADHSFIAGKSPKAKRLSGFIFDFFAAPPSGWR